jgi:hypothetical protein
MNHITKAYSIMDLMNGWSLEVSFMLWLLYSQGKSFSTHCIRVIKNYGTSFGCIIIPENYSYFSQSTLQTIAVPYIRKSL